MRLLPLLLLAPLAPDALAQLPAPPLSRWNLGLKLGTGHSTNSRDFAPSAPTGGSYETGELHGWPGPTLSVYFHPGPRP